MLGANHIQWHPVLLFNSYLRLETAINNAPVTKASHLKHVESPEQTRLPDVRGFDAHFNSSDRMDL